MKVTHGTGISLRRGLIRCFSTGMNIHTQQTTEVVAFILDDGFGILTTYLLTASDTMKLLESYYSF